MRNGEIACYKQFLLFSQCFPQLYIFSASKCGIVWKWVRPIFSASTKVLTPSQMTNFRLCQTERDCRQQFQTWRKWQKVFPTGRKHCEKRINCSLGVIYPFCTVFSKDLYCRHVQTRACLEKKVDY